MISSRWSARFIFLATAVMTVAFLGASSKMTLAQSPGASASAVTADRNAPYRPGDAITVTLRFAQPVAPDLQFTVRFQIDGTTPDPPVFEVGVKTGSSDDRRTVVLRGVIPGVAAGRYKIVKIEARSNQGDPYVVNIPSDAAPIVIAPPDLNLESITTAR